MTSEKILSEQTVDPSPFTQFDFWYKEHLLSGIDIPDSVSLGTSTANGHVSVRTVLLKGYSGKGFLFFTNYMSRKGKQLSSNKRAALLFYWPESGRQVRIEGITEKVTRQESDAYFKTRPRESQLASWASEQSSPIPDRQYLEEKFDIYREKFSAGPVTRPEHWGGFLIIPDWFEFWQNGEFRLHDRITYIKTNGVWSIQRLAP